MPVVVDRRGFLGALPVAACLSRLPVAAADPAPAPFSLGFSLYGMNGLPLAEALQACADIGYRDVEPALMPGFSAEPATLSAAARGELRNRLAGLNLAVPAVMENLRPVVPDDAAHQANLEALKRAAELLHDLSPRRPAIVETVLGGKPNEWPTLRGALVERLGAWAEVGRRHDLVVAAKAHVSNALHTPDDAAWLVEQVASPHLRLAFDYSHFQLQGFPLTESLEKLLRYTVFIHVKDARGTAQNVEFLLPGQGTVDYDQYFRLLRRRGYAGSVTVEVSAMLHKRPDYDPRAAARSSYAALKTAFDRTNF